MLSISSVSEDNFGEWKDIGKRENRQSGHVTSRRMPEKRSEMIEIS